LVYITASRYANAFKIILLFVFAGQYLQSVNAMSLSHPLKEDYREEGKIKIGAVPKGQSVNNATIFILYVIASRRRSNPLSLEEFATSPSGLLAKTS
jgi:hypothetical protein